MDSPDWPRNQITQKRVTSYGSPGPQKVYDPASSQKSHDDNPLEWVSMVYCLQITCKMAKLLLEGTNQMS